MQRIQTKNHELSPPYGHNIKLPPPYVPPMSYPTPQTTIKNSHTFDPQTHTPVYMYPNKRVHLPFKPLDSYPMQSLFHIFDDNGKKLNMDNLLKGNTKEIWLK